MTVKELKNKLKKYGDDEEVVYRDIGGQLQTIDNIEYGYALDGDSEIVLEQELQEFTVDDRYNKYVVVLGD